MRQLLGYKRLAQSELLAPINELLAEWSLWKNLFCTTMEQLSATREGSKQKRQHVKMPRTPAQRLLASAQLSAEQHQWIEERLATINPFTMKARIVSEVRCFLSTSEGSLLFQLRTGDDHQMFGKNMPIDPSKAFMYSSEGFINSLGLAQITAVRGAGF